MENKTEKLDYLETNTYFSGTQWYQPVLACADTLKHFIFQQAVYQEVLDICRQLEPDDYLEYLTGFFEKGIRTFGPHWQYADICTVLLGLSKKLQPKSYLEIGVRRGRSLAMVVSQCPYANVVGFDMWKQDYAGMENPGPEFVESQMRNLGFNGTIEFISGNSHETLPWYFRNNPDSYFDMITVDGDHSEKGAEQDLIDVLGYLSIGGVIVFDDIVHPKHEYLLGVWRRIIGLDIRFSCFEFTRLGYGVAFAVRKF